MAVGRNIFDVAVIGGGPAGMMAAGRAAELGAKVVLLEKNAKPGRKLLMTGNGLPGLKRNQRVQLLSSLPVFTHHNLARIFFDVQKVNKLIPAQPSPGQKLRGCVSLHGNRLNRAAIQTS